MYARCLVLLLGLSGLAGPALAQAGPDAGQEIRALEDALARGLIDKDRDVFERLLAPEFVLRGRPDVDRATWIDNATSLCWGTQATIEAFEVRPLGDARVATFVLATDRDPVTCEPAVVQSLITDVWLRVDGNWQLALRQSGPTAAGVESQYTEDEPPAPQWTGKGELSLVATAGNTSTQTLGMNGELDYHPALWQTTARVAFVRAETDGEETARSLSTDLRVSRDLTARLGVFGHAGYLRDTFAGIEHRLGADGGITYAVVDAAPHSLKLDAGLGYTNETRVDEPDRSFATGTLTLVYKWALSTTTEIANDAAFTANLQEGNDWRFNDTVAVSARLNSVLALKLSYALKFLNEPVPGFKKTDRVTSVALVAQFAK